jgi:hypothetical protein
MRAYPPPILGSPLEIRLPSYPFYGLDLGSTRLVGTGEMSEALVLTRSWAFRLDRSAGDELQCYINEVPAGSLSSIGLRVEVALYTLGAHFAS